MKKLDDLNLFYAQQLMDVGVYDVDGSGMLSFKIGDGTAPVLLKKKRLVLPTEEFLREGDWEQRTAFNPFSEQLNCGPSDVLNGFKDYIRVTCGDKMVKIAMLLMHNVVHSDKTTVSPKSMDLHTQLAEADEKTLDTLTSVVKEISNKPDKRLISILLKTNQGTGYLRSSIVSFPIFKDADSSDTTHFFGVKMPRKTKDKRLIVDLLKYVTGTTQQEEYTFGSNDRTAPFYHALLQSFEKLATHLNVIIDRHSGDVEGLSDLRFNLAWVDTLKVFPTFAQTAGAVAPPTPGNRGELIDGNRADLSVYSDTSESTTVEPKMEKSLEGTESYVSYRERLRLDRDDRRDRRDDRDYRDRDRDRDRRDRDDRPRRRQDALAMDYEEYRRRFR